MACKACLERGKNWQGSDPRCAFPDNGVFTPDNWSCATLEKLRDFVYEGQASMPPRVDYRYCDDDKYATLCVHDLDGLDGALALWISWYKSRGATDALWLLFQDKPPRRPTEQELLTILAALA